MVANSNGLMRHPSLIIGFALSWSLASCEAFDGAHHVSVSGVGGLMNSFEIDNREIDDGEAAGATIRLRTTPQDLSEFDVGLRVDAMYKRVNDTSAGISTDLDGLELGIAPIIRWKPPIGGDSSTPYIELFGGFTYTWADVTLSGGGLSVARTDRGGGAYYGGGAGVEFDVGDQIGVNLGAEYVWLDYDFSTFDFEEGRIQAYVGLTHRF